MTAAALPRALESRLERIPLRPAEGWLTVVMVGVLVEAFAWSLIDAAWIPANQGSVGYLSWLAFGGIVVEFIGAKAGWSRWLTHLIGAILAGLLLPIIAGATVLEAAGARVDLTDLAALYRAAGTVAFDVWADLVRDGRPFTSQFGHYHIVFGALVWAAGMAASSAVFNRRRPFDAVVVVGILLLTSMTLTSRPQLVYLVVFSVAALILLVRAHTFEEQVTWMRRRIGDPAAVSALYLQGGVTFVTAAVFAALILTATASSAPLQGLWSDLPSRLSGLSDWIQRFAPAGGAPRPFGAVGFGSSATTKGLWSPVSGVAFTAKVAGNVTTPWKWRAGTYSTYDGFRKWSWADSATVLRPAGSNVLAGTGDDPTLLADRHNVTITVTPDLLSDPTILSPQTILTVDRDTTLVLTGDRFTSLEETSSGGSYTVTASLPTFDATTPGGITENRLRNTVKVYPDDIKAAYLPFPEGSVGPKSLAINDEVKRLADAAGGPAGNPYDLAATLQDYLRSSAFSYQTDVRDLVQSHCGGLSSVECFATIRKGYCQFYATFMTILLRYDGIPARIAYGFLPGGTRGSDGSESVQASAEHWWVEAYFAGYGWIEFDPTGTVGSPQSIPAGTLETPRPLSSGGSLDRDRLGIERGGNSTQRPGGLGAGTTKTPPSSGTGPFAAIAVLLAIAVVALVISARRRPARFPMDADNAWGGIGRLADRFGLGPRPAQTVYEYAGALGEALPTARAEVAMVARAKVEVAYGRQTLGPDRLRAVSDAYRRLRIAIVRRGLGRWLRRAR
jgi:hypothetical protein